MICVYQPQSNLSLVHETKYNYKNGVKFMQSVEFRIFELCLTRSNLLKDIVSSDNCNFFMIFSYNIVII